MEQSNSKKRFSLHKIYFLSGLVCLLVSFSVLAANIHLPGVVNIQGQLSIGTTADPASTGVLDLVSTSKGFYMPRMSTTQQNAISSPAEGLMLYDNVLHMPSFHNGTSFRSLVDLSTAQTLSTKSLSGSSNTFTNIPLSAFTNLGTTSTVLHGNAAGSPTFSSVVDADVSASAAIARSKIAAGTPLQIVANDGSGLLTSVNPVTIGLGGTNNSSLGVAAGGMFYSDGSKFVSMGAGSAGQVPISNGASAPTWGTPLGGLVGDRELNPNPTVDVAVTGYTAYADAAGALPVDGTGGAPNTTCTRTTSSPITGAGSLLITKAGSANRQGEGCAILSNTLSTADLLPTVEQIDFDYQIASGTFTAGSDGPSGVASDYEVFLYDVTNAVVVQPLVYKLYSNAKGHFTSWFQTATNATTYRLIFHNATTTTNNFTIAVDNISMHPAKGNGSGSTNIVAQLNTLSSTTITANAAITFTTIGVDTANALSSLNKFTCPIAGNLLVTAFSDSLSSSTTALYVAKNGTFTVTASNKLTVISSSQGSGGAIILPCLAGDFFQLSSNASVTSLNTNTNLGFYLMGSGNSGSSIPNPVVAIVQGTSTSITAGGGTIAITPTSILKDTNSAFSGSTYTIPFPGFYQIEMVGSTSQTNAGDSASAHILHNATDLQTSLGNVAAFAPNVTLSGSIVRYCLAGDTIKFAAATSGTTVTPSNFYGSIFMLPLGGGGSPAGTVSSGSYNLERIERLTVTPACTTATCTITRQSGKWATSVTRSAAGNYSVNFPVGTWSDIPTCIVSVGTTGSAYAVEGVISTTSNVGFDTFINGTTDADSAFHVICMGPR